MKFLLVFLVGATRDFVATLETKAIAHGAVARATMFAGLGDVLWFTLTYLIAHDSASKWFFLPSALGNVVATNLAVRMGKRETPHP